MEYSISLSPWLDAVITIGWVTFFLVIMVLIILLVNALITGKNVRALQKVMLEQLELGEEVTINDEDRSYFSFHAIRIGLDVYYPVLKMQGDKIVVDHLLKKHCDRYSHEKIPGSEYETLCLQEKCANIRKEI